MNWLTELPITIARHTPRSLKRLVHGNRTIEKAVFGLYGAIIGGSNVTIVSGPMRGLKLVLSRNISHAHVQGDYEAEILAAIDQCVEPGDVCYDLGASIGYLTLLMAKKARHVYAFEPSPKAIEELLRQVSINNFTNVTLVRSPVSDQEREVRFCVTDQAYGSGISETETSWPVLNLQSTTLDRFAASNAPPDFLKIDVEGEETRVLQGGLGVIEKCRPKICCEVHSRETAREVAELLTACGYQLTTPDGAPFHVPTDVIAGNLHLIAIARS